MQCALVPSQRFAPNGVCFWINITTPRMWLIRGHNARGVRTVFGLRATQEECKDRRGGSGKQWEIDRPFPVQPPREMRARTPDCPSLPLTQIYGVNAFMVLRSTLPSANAGALLLAARRVVQLALLVAAAGLAWFALNGSPNVCSRVLCSAGYSVPRALV